MIKKNNILGTNIPRLIVSRFKIIRNMLLGKNCLYGEDNDIGKDVQLSHSTTRAYLDKLAESGYINKEFFYADHVPCGPGWPSHFEYRLNSRGFNYVESQLKHWATTDSFDANSGDEIRTLISRRRKK